MKTTDCNNIKLAGVTQGESQEVIKQIVVGSGIECFSLIREPQNPYDPYAVRVDCYDMYIGYIPQRISRGVAKMMDNGQKLTGRLNKVNSSPNHSTLGLTIDIVEE
jgi:hypothetical protein